MTYKIIAVDDIKPKRKVDTTLLDYQAARFRLETKIRMLFSKTQIITPGFKMLSSADVLQILENTIGSYEKWLTYKGIAGSRKIYDEEKVSKKIDIELDLREAERSAARNPNLNLMLHSIIADIYLSDPQAFYGVKKFIIGFGGSDFEASGMCSPTSKTIYVDINKFVDNTAVNESALRHTIIHELRHAKTHRVNKRQLEELKKHSFDIHQLKNNPIIKEWGYKIESFADLIDEYYSEFSALEYQLENHGVIALSEAMPSTYIKELFDSYNQVFSDYPSLKGNTLVQALCLLREKIEHKIDIDSIKMLQRLREIISWDNDLKAPHLKDFVSNEIDRIDEDATSKQSDVVKKEICQLLKEIRMLMES